MIIDAACFPAFVLLDVAISKQDILLTGDERHKAVEILSISALGVQVIKLILQIIIFVVPETLLFLESWVCT